MIVNDQQNESLTALLMEDEIYTTICSLNATSSLGPDGIGECFYKACWNITRLDMVASIQGFFTHHRFQIISIIFIVSS